MEVSHYLYVTFLDTENRTHFLALTFHLMRQVLVDYARSHGAGKRSADRRVDLDISVELPQVRSADVVALDDAFTDLSNLDGQQGRIVELRFFGGLLTEEIAEVLGFSTSSVKRDGMWLRPG
jgi:RNA polymerase sigma factor (TIGR02999 family)